MATYMVSFDDGRAMHVCAADSKQGRKVAVKRAVARVRKGFNDASKPGKTAKPVSVRCVG